MELHFQVKRRDKLLDTTPDQWVWSLIDKDKDDWICTGNKHYETSDNCVNAVKEIYRELHGSYSIEVIGWHL